MHGNKIYLFFSNRLDIFMPSYAKFLAHQHFGRFR